MVKHIGYGYSRILNGEVNGHRFFVVMERATSYQSWSFSNPNDKRALFPVHFSQLAHVMKYLHQQLFLHRDLKVGNILIGEGNVLLLADFGTAAPLDKYNGTKLGEIIHSPECRNGSGYGLKADVYAFGCVMWQMWTGLFQESPLDFKYANSAFFPPGESPTEIYATLIEECLSYSPADRPHFQQICERISLV